MVHLLEELQKSEADIILLQEAGKKHVYLKYGEVKKKHVLFSKLTLFLLMFLCPKWDT